LRQTTMINASPSNTALPTIIALQLTCFCVSDCKGYNLTVVPNKVPNLRCSLAALHSAGYSDRGFAKARLVIHSNLETCQRTLIVDHCAGAGTTP
jgi:hypothetical protein